MTTAVYVCGKSALEHYREAVSPAQEGSKATSLRTAVSSLGAVQSLSLVGLGLPEPTPQTPLYVLVHPHASRGGSKSVRPMSWGCKIPKGALRKVSADAFVSSPEFVFLQMARELELVELIELGMELCGTYRRHESGPTAYDYPPLTTPGKLKTFLKAAGPAPGIKRAREATKYLIPNSASPFETIVYLLLCLPRRLGGYAFPRPILNVRVRIGARGRQHTLRRSSYPDLYWRSVNLDLECHGADHEREKTRTADSMRRKALERMKVEVVELTYAEMTDPELFRATVKRLAKKLGFRLRARNEGGFAQREDTLRAILLCSTPDARGSFEEQRTLGFSNLPELPKDSVFEDWFTDELPPEFEDWSAIDLPAENTESWLGEELPSEFESWEVHLLDV